MLSTDSFEKKLCMETQVCINELKLLRTWKETKIVECVFQINYLDDIWWFFLYTACTTLCNLEKLESYLQYHTKQFIQIQCITKRYNFKSSEASREFPRWEKSQQLSLWSSTHSCLVSRQKSASLLPRFVHVVSSEFWAFWSIFHEFPQRMHTPLHRAAPLGRPWQLLRATAKATSPHRIAHGPGS